MTTINRNSLALLTLAVLLVGGLARPVRADDEALRKQALALNEVTGTAPATAALLKMVDQADETRKLLKVARTMAKEKEQPFNVNATLVLARTAEVLKEVDASRDFYRLHINQAVEMQSGRRLVNGYAGMIELFFNNGRYEECEKVCQEFLELKFPETQEEQPVSRMKAGVKRQMVLALARQGEVDKARKSWRELVKAQPKNYLNLKLGGRIYSEAGQTEDAAKYYEKLIDDLKKDEDVDPELRDEAVADVRYTLSNVYIDLKQVDKAVAELKALVEKEPKNPTFNNDLGYIMADNDLNLEEAEKFIRKALDEEQKVLAKITDLKPEDRKANPSYLDSLGWVLFKQKKYKEAKEPLLEAVKQEEGKHTEIFDHLGDVHWELGEKAEAIAAWKKAVEVAKTSKREQQRKAEVEKKLKSRE